MSDDDSVPSFLDDVRVQFVEEKVCELLRLQRETWEKSAANEEFQTFLKNFFEKEPVIFFSSSTNGCLLSTREVWLLHSIFSHIS